MLRVEACPDFERMRVLLLEYETLVASMLSLDTVDYESIDRARAFDARYVATLGDELAGCVALRRFADGIGEIKHLYVRPAFRGFGAGRALMEEAIGEARTRGFRSVRLDTLPAMKSAQALYAAMGFREIPRYHTDLQVEGVRFMELSLR